MNKDLLIDYLQSAREYSIKTIKDNAEELICSIKDDQRSFLKDIQNAQ